MADWLLHTTGQVVLVGLVEAGVLMWLYRTRRRAAVVSAVLVPLAGAALVIADLARESPREYVERALEEIRSALLAGDAQQILDHLDPDYDYEGLTYERLATVLPERLRRWHITTIRITDRQFTTIADTRIAVRLEVRAAGRTLSGFGIETISTWRLTFLPIEERWVLAEIDPVKLNGRSFRRLSDLL